MKKILNKKEIISYIKKYAAQLSAKEQTLLQVGKSVAFIIKKINEKWKDGNAPAPVKTIKDNLSESLKYLSSSNVLVKDPATNKTNYQYYSSLIDNIYGNIQSLRSQQGISDFDPEENIQYFIMWIDQTLPYLSYAKTSLSANEEYLAIDKEFQKNLYKLYKLPIGPNTIDGKLGPQTMELINKARKNLLTPPYFSLENLNERVKVALQYPSAKDYIIQEWGKELLPRAGF